MTAPRGSEGRDLRAGGPDLLRPIRRIMSNNEAVAVPDGTFHSIGSGSGGSARFRPKNQSLKSRTRRGTEAPQWHAAAPTPNGARTSVPHAWSIRPCSTTQPSPNLITPAPRGAARGEQYMVFMGTNRVVLRLIGENRRPHGLIATIAAANASADRKENNWRRDKKPDPERPPSSRPHFASGAPSSARGDALTGGR